MLLLFSLLIDQQHSSSCLPYLEYDISRDFFCSVGRSIFSPWSTWPRPAGPSADKQHQFRFFVFFDAIFCLISNRRCIPGTYIPQQHWDPSCQQYHILCIIRTVMIADTWYDTYQVHNIIGSYSLGMDIVLFRIWGRLRRDVSDLVMILIRWMITIDFDRTSWAINFIRQYTYRAYRTLNFTGNYVISWCPIWKFD